MVCKYNDDIIISLPANSVGFGGVAPINILPFNEPKNSNLRKIDIDLYPEPDHYPNVIKALINNPNMIGKLAFYRSGIFSEIKGSSLNLVSQVTPIWLILRRVKRRWQWLLKGIHTTPMPIRILEPKLPFLL